MQKSAIAVATVFLLGAAWAQDSPKPSSPSTPDAPKVASAPAVPTRTYKGTLVDASCAGNVTQTSPAASTESNAADRQEASKTASASQGCAVSASSKEFALRTKEGRLLRFDAVGNERAADAIKNKKNWSTAMSAGKPITAKVEGTALDGDNVTVLAID
jgi:hypothetical protein